MNKQMKFSCPNCDSEKIAIEKRPGGWFHCQDCHYSWQPYPVRFGFDVPSHKPTIFNRITASPEVLAEKLVFCAEYKTIRPMYLEGKGGIVVAEVWKSTIIPDATFSSEPEAIAATVAKLKEVENG
jgi:hypothetical protein